VGSRAFTALPTEPLLLAPKFWKKTSDTDARRSDAVEVAQRIRVVYPVGTLKNSVRTLSPWSGTLGLFDDLSESKRLAALVDRMGKVL
jgi:hypothetical protein